jgi:hypothetical protein
VREEALAAAVQEWVRAMARAMAKVKVKVKAWRWAKRQA